MLYDNDRYDRADDLGEWPREPMRLGRVVITPRPSPAVRGAVDVMSLRALFRTVRFFCSQGKSEGDALNRAIAQTINLNGAIAGELLNDRRGR